ncbi:MAG: hypothetical protein RMJ19_06625 [Gemmatales bacterium]|nr:hypothetical protein [Gemmatales bacterium]MCS7160129.1 hypothetical protein [Gemmatales bacterium]MDW8175329.1 hypothetical protein [Gemmatales bacterium]MDW8222652.1 hypothetical protein [Gemmatales bacterium]
MDVLGVPRVAIDVLGTQVERLAQHMGVNRLGSAEEPDQSRRAMHQAAKSFEAIFASLIVKHLRTSTQEMGEGLFAGDEADIYGGLFDYYLGQFLAQGRGLGIARLIEEQYARQPWSSPVEEVAGRDLSGRSLENTVTSEKTTSAGTVSRLSQERETVS